MKFLKVIISLCLIAVSFTIFSQEVKGAGILLNGKVFDDINKNGSWDPGEPGIENILVSDGEHIVKTDSQGNYKILSSYYEPYASIFISKPTGYIIKGSFFKYYNDSPKQTINFPLLHLQHKNSNLFVAIADFHLGGHHITSQRLGKDLNEVDETAKNINADFIVTLGDCTDHGKEVNLKDLSDLFATMSKPLYHVFGAHSALDLYKKNGKYSDTTLIYRKYIGPIYYSFNYGKTHFMVLPSELKFLTKKQKQRYETWLTTELKLLDHKTPLIILQHTHIRNVELFAKHNLIGVFYGHWHDGHSSYHKGHLELSVPPCSFGGYYVNNPRGENIVDFSSDKLQVAFRNLGVNEHISLHTFNESDKYLQVSVYDSTSPIRTVTYRMSKATTNSFEMQHQHGWLWSKKLSLNEFKNNDKLYIEATTDAGKKFTKSFNLKEFKNKGGFSLKFHSQVWLSGTFLSGNNPQIKNDTLYITVNNYSENSSLRGAVFALSPETLKVKWKFQSNDSIKGGLDFDDNGCYFTTDTGDLYKINQKDGQILWKFIADNDKTRRVFSTPSYHNGFVYAFVGGGFRKFNATTGAVEWATNLSLVTPKPLIIKNKVYVFSSKYFHCLDANSGKELWRLKSKGKIIPSPVYHNGIIFSQAGVGSKDKHKPFRAMNIENNKIIWSNTNWGGAVYAAVDTVNVYASTHKGRVFAFRQNDGQELWRFQTKESIVDCSRYKRGESTLSSPVVPLNDGVLFGGNDGYVYYLDKNSGKVICSYNIGIPILASCAVKGNLVYVPTLDGHIYVLEIIKEK